MAENMAKSSDANKETLPDIQLVLTERRLYFLMDLTALSIFCSLRPAFLAAIRTAESALSNFFVQFFPLAEVIVLLS